jgi:hypothetical protein
MNGTMSEELTIDSRGGVWWVYWEHGAWQETYLGREHTPEELQHLALWAKRRGMVLPPELASLKLPKHDSEWGHVI